MRASQVRSRASILWSFRRLSLIRRASRSCATITSCPTRTAGGSLKTAARPREPLRRHFSAGCVNHRRRHPQSSSHVCRVKRSFGGNHHSSTHSDLPHTVAAPRLRATVAVFGSLSEGSSRPTFRCRLEENTITTSRLSSTGLGPEVTRLSTRFSFACRVVRIGGRRFPPDTRQKSPAGPGSRGEPGERVQITRARNSAPPHGLR